MLNLSGEEVRTNYRCPGHRRCTSLSHAVAPLRFRAARNFSPIGPPCTNYPRRNPSSHLFRRARRPPFYKCSPLLPFAVRATSRSPPRR